MRKRMSKRRAKAKARLYGCASKFCIMNYQLHRWFHIGDAISVYTDVCYVTAKK